MYALLLTFATVVIETGLVCDWILVKPLLVDNADSKKTWFLLDQEALGPCCQCPAIINRSQWGARPATGTSYMTNPVSYAFIHHSAGPECHDRASCTDQIRQLQNYHMDTNGWPDIGYNFLIGGDGSVFEGRGWDKVGWTQQGYGFCFIGTFKDHLPSTAAQSAVKSLIDCGVHLGKLRSGYTLRGHRDLDGNTECPGTALYSFIKSWPHY